MEENRKEICKKYGKYEKLFWKILKKRIKILESSAELSDGERAAAKKQ